MRLSNIQLVKIAAIGGFITCTMGTMYKFKVNENISKTEYFKEALKALRGNAGAVHLLGEPIKTKLIELGATENNYTLDYSAHYEVPVRGPKGKGVLFFWASRKNLDDAWCVDRVELGLDGDEGKRLLIRGDKQNRENSE